MRSSASQVWKLLTGEALDDDEESVSPSKKKKDASPQSKEALFEAALGAKKKKKSAVGLKGLAETLHAAFDWDSALHDQAPQPTPF